MKDQIKPRKGFFREYFGGTECHEAEDYSAGGILGRPRFSLKRRIRGRYGDAWVLTAIALSLEACSNSPSLVEGEGGIVGDGTPEIELSDSLASDTGLSSKDLYTSNTRPTVNVSGPINTPLVVKDSSGRVLGKGTTGPDGKTSINLDSDLVRGENRLSVETEEEIPRGSEGFLVVTVDTVGARLVLDSSKAYSDLLINAEELKSFGLLGKEAEGGARFRLRLEGGGNMLERDFSATSILTSGGMMLSDEEARVGAFYEWSLGGIDLSVLFPEAQTMPEDVDGSTVEAFIYQTDLAGNVGAESAPIVFTLDLMAPKPLDVKAVSLKVDASIVMVSFDENLVGSFTASSLTLVAMKSGGGEYRIDKDDTFKIDGMTISFSLTNVLAESDSLEGWTLTYTKERGDLRDLAGNAVESFTLTGTADDATNDFTTDGGSSTGGGGLTLPTGLMITLDETKESASGGRNMDLVTMEDEPLFMAEWTETLEDSYVFLFVTDQNGNMFDVGSAYVNGDMNVDLQVGRFVDKESKRPFERDDVLLVDGEYDVGFRVENMAPGSPATLSGGDVIEVVIDTKAPSIVANSYGVVRTGEGSFEVHLSEAAYYGGADAFKVALEEKIKGALSFKGTNFSALSLGSGESFGGVMLTGVDEIRGTFTGFSFEIQGLTGTDTSIVYKLATLSSASLFLEKGTIEDRAGNENDALYSSSLLTDFRPPTGDDKSFGLHTLVITFDVDAEEFVTGGATTVGNYKVTRKDGVVYTVTSVTFDEDTNELVLTISEVVEGQELTVEIKGGVFKSEGDSWNNINIKHDVKFDLRSPSVPKVNLVDSDDTGTSSSDNLTRVNTPRLEFSLGADDKGGTLKITIKGLTATGERYEIKLAEVQLASGGTYTPPDLPKLPDGEYDVLATITDEYGRESEVGYLEDVGGISGSAGTLLMYTLEGADKDLFDVEATAFQRYGVLSFKTSPTYTGVLADDTYEVTLVVSDSAGGVVRRDIEVVVTMGTGGTNAAPEFDSLSTRIFVEDGMTAVETFTATDGDGDTLTYTLEGADSASFSIDNATGMVTFSSPADYGAMGDADGDNAYEITVVVSDGMMGKDYHDVTVTVLPEANVGPMFDVALSSVKTVMGGDLVVGSFVAMDVLNHELTYKIGGADQRYFSISSDGVLTFNNRPSPTEVSSFMSQAGTNVYSIRILSSDGKETASHDLMVTVSGAFDKSNALPVFLMSGSFLVEEGGVNVGRFEARDDDGDTLSYSLEGADASLFSVNGAGEVVFMTAPGYGSPMDVDRDNDYEFTVVVSDGKVNSYLHAMVSVTDRNDAPVITLPASGANVSVLEGTLFVLNVRASDADGDVLMYSLKGVDKDSFTVTSDGLIEFMTSPVFGARNLYDLTVRVEDGRGGDVEHGFMVTVTERVAGRNQEPDFVAGTEHLINVNEGLIWVWRFGARDGDGDALSYSLSGADSGKFSLDAATGVLVFMAAPDFEMPDSADGDNVYKLRIEAMDGMGGSVGHDFSVIVRNVNENPGIDSADDPLMFSVEDGDEFVGAVGAMDPDSDSYPKLVIDRKAPELVSVIPVFALTGTNKLQVTFNELIDTTIDYSWFSLSTSSFSFDRTKSPTFSSGGSILDLYITPILDASSLPSDFRLKYTAPGLGSGVKDLAGNFLEGFEKKVEILSSPTVTSSSWSAGTGGTGDKLILTFNENVSWIGGALTDRTRDPVLDDGTGAPLMLMDGANYDFDLTGNMLTITFQTVGLQLPKVDDLMLSFGGNVFGLDTAGTPGGSSAPNVAFVLTFDTLAPSAPTLDDPPSPVVVSNFNGDLFINGDEEDGTIQFSVTGSAGAGADTTDIYIELTNGTNTVKVDGTPGLTWDIMLDAASFVALDLMHGETVTVTAYHDDGTNMTESGNMLTFEVDLEGPSLAAADPVKALIGTRIVLVEFDEALWSMSPDLSQFTVKHADAGGTFKVDPLDTAMMAEILGSVVRFYLNNDVLSTDMVTVSYTSGLSDLVRDKAGNDANNFADTTAMNSYLPVVESIMVDSATRELTIKFINTIAEITAGGEMLGGEDFKLFDMGTNEILNSIAGTPMITGDTLTLTLTTAAFGALDMTSLHRLQLLSGVLQDAATAMGENLETDLEFDLSPPGAPTIMLSSSSDTGHRNDDGYTMANSSSLEWTLSSLGEDVEIEFEIRAGTGTLPGTVSSFTGDFMNGDVLTGANLGLMAGDMLGDGTYEVRALSTRDKFGNARAYDATAMSPGLTFTVDTMIVWNATTAIDNVGIVSGTVGPVISLTPFTDGVYYVEGMFKDLNLSLHYVLESQNIVAVDYAVVVSRTVPTTGVFMNVDSLTQGAGMNQVDVSIKHSVVFADTYGDPENTYILFKITDAAGNETTLESVVLDVVHNLGLGPALVIGLDSTTTDLHPANGITQGRDDGMAGEFVLGFEVFGSEVTWGDVTRVEIVEERAKVGALKNPDGSFMNPAEVYYASDPLVTGREALEVTFSALGVPSAGAMFAAGNKLEVELVYNLGAVADKDTVATSDQYYDVYYKINLYNDRFTALTPNEQFLMFTVDRVDPVFRSALIYGLADGSGGVQVSELIFFADGWSSGAWAPVDDGSGEDIWVRSGTDGMFTNHVTFNVEDAVTRVTTNYADRIDRQHVGDIPDRSVVHKQGYAINFMNMLTLEDGDMVSIELMFDDNPLTATTWYVGDRAGNALNNTFNFVYRNDMFLDTSPGGDASFNGAKLIAVVLPTPSVDDGDDWGDDFDLSVLGVEFVMDDEGLL